MKNRLLKPFGAIFLCLLFGLPFVFFGFQSVEFRGFRIGDSTATIDFTREHFWGAVQTTRHVIGVLGAETATRRIRVTMARHSTASGVVLVTDSGQVPLFAGWSNLNEDKKEKAAAVINEFIGQSKVRRIKVRVPANNLFGWVGLPLLALGVLGFLVWPVAIVKGLRKRGADRVGQAIS